MYIIYTQLIILSRWTNNFHVYMHTREKTRIRRHHFAGSPFMFPHLHSFQREASCLVASKKILQDSRSLGIATCFFFLTFFSYSRSRPACFIISFMCHFIEKLLSISSSFPPSRPFSLAFSLFVSICPTSLSHSSIDAGQRMQQKFQ